MAEKKFTDIKNPKTANQTPDKSATLFSGGQYSEQGFVIRKVELRLYLKKPDSGSKAPSLITSFVETDKGSIEMVYEKGDLTEDSFEKTRTFLANNLGISGLILRSLISLREELKKHNS